MNKSELVDAIASGAGLSKLTLHALSTPPLAQSTVPSKAVTVFLSLVSVLSLSATALRTGRNPQTGAEIKIAAKNVVKFG